jgi:intraflagellar transport protein 52
VLVLGAPTEKFSVAELEALKKYVMGGGSLLVCMGEGGEKKHPTNINYLLEQFGTMPHPSAHRLQSSAVARLALPRAQLHPHPDRLHGPVMPRCAGMSVNSDCVVRTVHYKYFHPKEALITDGIINREINTQVTAGVP